MTEAAQLAAVLGAGGPGLMERLRATEARLAAIAAGHGATLARHASSTLWAGGKRLRPVLVFLCGGTESDRPLAAAVAVELLHTATLVHDDVLDQATLRRGQPTVFATAGREAATATGDLLFSRAFAELTATGNPAAVGALSEASSALARGELMQRADAWSPDIGERRYLERCALKTASLFAQACRLGAILGGGPAEHADALARFGERLGLAFQILDDVLDVSGPAERTGKHRGTDLLDGTVTLPLILARRVDGSLHDQDLRGEVTSAAAAEAVCERIEATGALAQARARALREVADAKSELDSVVLPDGRRRALELVADGVVDRYA